MKKLLIATHNPAKIDEMKNLFGVLPVQIISLADVGITKEVVEDGKTFEENSLKKALEYAKLANLPAVADDGGIEIAALNGQPGVNSKYWLGPNTTEEQLIEHMKKLTKTLPKNNRKIVFRTVLTLGFPNGKHFAVKGMTQGIVPEFYLERYQPGFPFRSFFYLPKLQKFFFDTELSEVEQKEYNHRYKAAQQLLPIIIQELRLKDFNDKSNSRF